MTDQTVETPSAATGIAHPWESRMPDDSAFREIATFADAVSMLSEHGFTLLHAESELGDGFAPWELSKDKLIDREMLILSVRESNSTDYRNPQTGEYSKFYIVRFVLPSPDGLARKYFLTDGGVGIGPQLMDILERRGNNTRAGIVGLFVPHGLRKSEYDATHPITGEDIHGVTYYLDSRGTGE